MGGQGQPVPSRDRRSGQGHLVSGLGSPGPPNPPPRAWAVAVSLLPGSSEPHRQAGPDDIVCGYFYPVTFLRLGGG